MMVRVAAEADSARDAIIRAAGPAAEQATAQLPESVLQMLQEHAGFLDTQGAQRATSAQHTGFLQHRICDHP